MPRRPEILAPAGDDDALAAALAAGADAVYFGLDEGFNARARARNFSLDHLAATVLRIHRAGARAFVTFNTLVFEPELPAVEALLRAIAAAGVDAVIVQDPAVAMLARAICPALEVHASTQMTLSSPLAARIAAALGATRVVVPRELSVDEIRAYAAGTPLELEVFVHGALCVAWSGQCLSSETWGSRSANRGQCAQACRLPYDLIVDGARRDLGDVRYLLSPRDLAGADAVPALAALGVASLKIEGRQKAAPYVHTAVAGYRRWRDALAAGDMAAGRAALADDLGAMALTYTRGQSAGFFAGVDHQTLVDGRHPGHRGVRLGEVVEVGRDHVVVVAPGPARASDAAAVIEPAPGRGVVFWTAGVDPDAAPGGPVFAATRLPRAAGDPPDATRWRLGFGRPGPDLARVAPGATVWITGDPKLPAAAARAVAEPPPAGRIAVTLTVRGAAGAPLEVEARAEAPHRALAARAASATPLQPARGAGLDAALLADKLGGLGGTAFALASTGAPGGIDAAALPPGLHLPVSELKEVRRALVAALDADLARVDRDLAPGPVLAAVRDAVRIPDVTDPGAPAIVPLVRDDAQLDAALALGVPEVELDWMELVGLGRAVARARAAGARVTVATVRVQKPGEDKIDAHLHRLEPDAVLVRSWGSLAYFAALPEADRPVLHGDFSLNVTNALTAGFVLGYPSGPGVATVTAAHDLDAAQLDALVAAAPRHRVAVTIHHHIPTFHTEHCVYAHLLSSGRDFRTCGRPCEAHRVSLQDRVGLVHPVVVDVGCRNTVFNAQAQSAAALVPRLLAAGVRRLRVELVRETAAETTRLLTAYRALVTGALTPDEVVRRAAVHEQFGVTRGTMRTLTVLP